MADDEARKYKGKAYDKLTADDVAGDSFTVTGAYVLVKTGTQEGVEWRGYLRNAPVPVDVEPLHLLHLLTHDLIGPGPVAEPTPMELAGQAGDGGASQVPGPVATPVAAAPKPGPAKATGKDAGSRSGGASS